jgi:hypothetical protein
LSVDVDAYFCLANQDGRILGGKIGRMVVQMHGRKVGGILIRPYPDRVQTCLFDSSMSLPRASPRGRGITFSALFKNVSEHFRRGASIYATH